MYFRLLLFLSFCLFVISCTNTVQKGTGFKTARLEINGESDEYSLPATTTPPEEVVKEDKKPTQEPIVEAASSASGNRNRNSNRNRDKKPKALPKELKQQVEEAKDFQEAMVEFIGAHFQSCAPMLYLDDTPKDIIKDFYKKKESYTGGKCKDRRKSDFNYISFGKGSMNPNAGLLKEKDGEIDALNRFNCSGFVASTMASGGLKYYQSQKKKFFSPRTHEIAEIFKKKDSCFFKPELSKRISILPGDILNVGHSHVVRILTVGKDPLGLNRIKKKSDCGNIKTKYFNFTFAHSTSKDKSKNISGVIVEEGDDASPSIIGKFAKELQKMCKKTFDKGLKGKIDDEKIGTKDIKVGFFKRKVDTVFSLRRHYGSEKKDCTFKVPEIRGGNCLKDQCLDEVYDSSNWKF